MQDLIGKVSFQNITIHLYRFPNRFEDITQNMLKTQEIPSFCTISFVFSSLCSLFSIDMFMISFSSLILLQNKKKNTKIGQAVQELSIKKVALTFWSPDFERIQISKNGFLRGTQQYFLHMWSKFRADPSTRGGCSASQPL